MKTKKGNEVKTIPKSYAVSEQTRSKLLLAKCQKGFKTFDQLFAYLVGLHEKQK